MAKKDNITEGTSISLSFIKPYDFALSLRVTNSFSPGTPQSDTRLLTAAWIDNIPAVIEISQASGKSGVLSVTSSPATDSRQLAALAGWILFAGLDLNPYYSLALAHKKTAPIIKRLHGIKPLRPASLFEMAVVAITEQQISLAAAYRIRERVVQRFGTSIKGQWIFPAPQALADARVEDLRSCGLSRQKADYILSLAGNIAGGKLEIDTLKAMDDAQARDEIMSWKGFGRWSADYILIRGLARPDCVPIDDLAIRSVVGEYLGEGGRMTANEVEAGLEPFRPYRGLMAFYLLAHHRLKSP